MIKILIVDDSETLRTELKEVLEGGGYEVVAGVDGNDGFNKAQENSGCKLIIADYNMPGMDGISMIKKIKSDIPEYKDTPCAMLTTESSAALKAQGKEAGVIVWFVKPFSPDKILKTIAKIQERFG